MLSNGLNTWHCSEYILSILKSCSYRPFIKVRTCVCLHHAGKREPMKAFQM